MHAGSPRHTRLVTQSHSMFTACLVAGLLAAGPARANCGCPDDGHGAPRASGAAGQWSWLSRLLDWRPAAPQPSLQAPPTPAPRRTG